MQTIAHIHRDTTVDWDELDDPDQRLLEHCGDIVLDLLDVWDPTQFFIDQVLERWADGWGFSLAGIAVPDAVHKMHVALVFPTIADLVPDFAEAVDQVRGIAVDDDDLDGPLGDMLDFPVRVNGALLREFLCDVFDGPFADDQTKLGALLLRTAE